MVLFPYRADVKLGRWPVLTLFVCLLCVWIFARQQISAHQYEVALERFCNQSITREELLVLRYVAPAGTRHYCDVLLEIRQAPDRDAAMRTLATEARPAPFFRNQSDSVEYVYRTLEQSMVRFDRNIPPHLTEKLQYDPSRLDIWRMITAAFSHGGWWHLVTNLLFFFAFAASVEVIVGYGYFFAFILVSAIGTHLAYRYSVLHIDMPAPTVGLSGVVMAMMGFLATIMPTLRIRAVFWFLIFVRLFRVPALAIAALYIVQNIVEYASRDADSTVNYVAHISGAALGVAFGVVYRLTHRSYLQALQPTI